MQVFQPTLVSKLIVENITVNQKDTVLDLGCGVGFIGLSLKDKCSFVMGSDVMPEAVEIARKNGLHAVVSNLYDNITMRFDVIISDVSGICEDIARISPWYPDQIPTGGLDGSDVQCLSIRRCKTQLRRNGRFYLPISSLSNSKKIKDLAKNTFSKMNLIYEKNIPLCKELEKKVDRLLSIPFVNLTTKGSRHLWKFELLECMV